MFALQHPRCDGFDELEGGEPVNTRVPWRAVTGLAVAAVAVLVVAFHFVGRGSAAEPPPTEKVSRDDIVVSVGGVGRVIQAGAVTRVPDAATSAGTSGGTSASSAPPANAVYPRTTGNVRKYLVVPGQRVAFGQPLLELDDGGAALAAVQLAEDDLAGARLELAQALGAQSLDLSAAELDAKRARAELETLLGGTPAARARAIRAATRNVEFARGRLDRALAPATVADVRTAEAEVKKAEADLAALKKPATPPSAKAVASAEQAVAAAQLKLARLTGPPDPVALSAAQADVELAEANLTVLKQRVDPAPTQAEFEAASAALEAAWTKRTQVAGPPNPADVSAAESDVKKAEADLDALTKATPPPTPEALAAGAKAVEAAKLKLAKLNGPPSAADVSAARLDLERAQSDLRALQLGPSSAAMDAALQAVSSSQAKLARLSGSPVGIARLKVKAAAAKLRTAHLTLRLLTVRSPSHGTVTALLSERGAPVERTTPIATVTNLDHLAVSVDLSEFDVAQVKLGQKVAVSVDALGGKNFPGKVGFVALTGTETSGVVTFPVRVRLARSGGLKPGMNVTVRIVVARRGDVLQVPLEAVTRDGANTYVTVVNKSGKETERDVKLGLANNEIVEVVDGLREGESVVVLGGPAEAGAEEA
jgi:RND family efflux transporter MFP subunit